MVLISPESGTRAALGIRMYTHLLPKLIPRSKFFLVLLVFSQVHGVIRRSSSFNTGRIKHLFGNPALHRGGGEVL